MHNPNRILFTGDETVVYIESLSQLIGAGGVSRAAAVAAQALDGKGCLGTFQKLCDGLEVAVAAAKEDDVGDLAVFQVELDHLGADAAGSVGEMHDQILLWEKK